VPTSVPICSPNAPPSIPDRWDRRVVVRRGSGLERRHIQSLRRPCIRGRLQTMRGVSSANIPGCAPSRDLHGLGKGQSRSGRPLDPSPAIVRALDQVSELLQGRDAANHQLSPLANETVGGEGVGGIPQGGNSRSVSGAEFPLGNTLGGVGGIPPIVFPYIVPGYSPSRGYDLERWPVTPTVGLNFDSAGLE
jgi:hypothetical protein